MQLVNRKKAEAAIRTEREPGLQTRACDALWIAACRQGCLLQHLEVPRIGNVGVSVPIDRDPEGKFSPEAISVRE